MKQTRNFQKSKNIRLRRICTPFRDPCRIYAQLPGKPRICQTSLIQDFFQSIYFLHWAIKFGCKDNENFSLPQENNLCNRQNDSDFTDNFTNRRFLTPKSSNMYEEIFQKLTRLSFWFADTLSCIIKQLVFHPPPAENPVMRFAFIVAERKVISHYVPVP